MKMKQHGRSQFFLTFFNILYFVYYNTFVASGFCVCVCVCIYIYIYMFNNSLTGRLHGEIIHRTYDQWNINNEVHLQCLKG